MLLGKTLTVMGVILNLNLDISNIFLYNVLDVYFKIKLENALADEVEIKNISWHLRVNVHMHSVSLSSLFKLVGGSL